jgi:methylated-DNA-[protein]-cysteine S-methyltransferase
MLAKHGGEGYARGMTICCYVASPVGRLALEADGEALTGVRWASAGERSRDKPSALLKEAGRQL